MAARARGSLPSRIVPVRLALGGVFIIMTKLKDRSSTCSCVSWAFDQQIRPPASKLLLIVLADNTGGCGYQGYRHWKASDLVNKTSMSIPEIEKNWKSLVKSGHINELYGEGAKLII